MTDRLVQIAKPRHILRAEKVQRNKDAALAAFIAKKAEIGAMLERLVVLSTDHFETSSDEIHWGHVGNLNHYRDRMREITDSAFKEGEHTE